MNNRLLLVVSMPLDTVKEVFETFGAPLLQEKYLPDFGPAAYCGLGRMPASEMPKVLDEHLPATRMLA